MRKGQDPIYPKNDPLEKYQQEPQAKCTKCGEWFPLSEFGTRGKAVCSMCKKFSKK